MTLINHVYIRWLLMKTHAKIATGLSALNPRPSYWIFLMLQYRTISCFWVNGLVTQVLVRYVEQNCPAGGMSGEYLQLTLSGSSWLALSS